MSDSALSYQRKPCIRRQNDLLVYGTDAFGKRVVVQFESSPPG